MTPLSLADGARLLGIHPKTLCHWLKEATLPLAAHPADARIKGVTQEDLQQVASWHGRPLPSSVLLDAASPSSVSSQVPALCGPEKETEPASTAGSFPLSHMPEADQIHRLASLESRMVTLQEQIAQLIWPSSSSACRVLAWSWWRRGHQSRASYYHTKRRLKAG